MAELPVAEQTLVGRVTGGHVDDLSPSTVNSMLGQLTWLTGVDSQAGKAIVSLSVDTAFADDTVDIVPLDTISGGANYTDYFTLSGNQLAVTTPGVYEVYAATSWAVSAVGTMRAVDLYAEFEGSGETGAKWEISSCAAPAFANANGYVAVSESMFLAPTDVTSLDPYLLYLYAYQDSGASLNLISGTVYTLIWCRPLAVFQ